MVQLAQFQFDKGGMIEFSGASNEPQVGMYRRLDHFVLTKRFLDGDDDETLVYTTTPACADTQAFYTAGLDSCGPREPGYVRGSDTLMRRLIALLPEPKDDRKAFVMIHPDFDIQNFLVEEDGSLVAIIDWDGVRSVPQSLGNFSLPGWLTRDWDPLMYRYTDSLKPQNIETGRIREDSPSTLAMHRSEYIDIITQLSSPSQLGGIDYSLPSSDAGDAEDDGSESLGAKDDGKDDDESAGRANADDKASGSAGNADDEDNESEQKCILDKYHEYMFCEDLDAGKVTAEELAAVDRGFRLLLVEE
ncbi:hypothetical protein MRB53_040943 [Persea americana]|nr:hypothetical protein MRB53_040943 [Persea americana]